ncbi:MAG: iron ABC transporter permease [Vulcanimicrobiota bacterium]
MRSWLLVGLLALVGLMLLGLGSGSYHLGPQQVWKALLQGPAQGSENVVVWQLRLPRLLQAALVGSALSAAGAAFQSLLRSPLADPYLTGTSAGASLGTAIAVVLGLSYGWFPVCAFGGAVLSVWLVTRLARVQSGVRLEDFLLAGVMVSTLLGSLVSLLMVLAGRELGRLVFFLLGNLSGSNWPLLGWCLAPLLLGVGLLAWNAYALNLLSLGEELAGPAGVAVEKVKLQVLLAATLLTAAAVCSSGLVGFVGLVIPHLCRLWVGPDMRRLLPLCLVWGAVFLLGCDWLTRMAPQELPVGVVTALLGAPWFLSQLRARQRERQC